MKEDYEIWTKNLTKVYDKRSKQTKAVDCINLRAEPGVHGFLGPNGAGKTTTIWKCNLKLFFFRRRHHGGGIN